MYNLENLWGMFIVGMFFGLLLGGIWFAIATAKENEYKGHEPDPRPPQEKRPVEPDKVVHSWPEPMYRTRAVEKGNPVSGDLITGDGEFILRLLESMAHIYKCPPDYEEAWEKLRDLGLIEYISNMVYGGFRPTYKGRLELKKIRSLRID